MKNKKLIANFFLKAGKAVKDFHDRSPVMDGDAVKLARFYERNSVDALLLFDLSDDKWEQAANLEVIRSISGATTLPLVSGGSIHSSKDAENLLDAGCSKVFLDMSEQSNVEMLSILADAFGKEKLAVCINDFTAIHERAAVLKESVSLVILMGDHLHLYDAVNSLALPAIPIISVANYDHVLALLSHENVVGVSGKAISDPEADLLGLRRKAFSRGINLQKCECNFKWSDLKRNSDDMIPVIVQDYKNQQVLMMAYMNEEAFNHTLLTGRMTYYSRSRKQLWVKGETSGHLQYVKQILIDCDNDTLLAKIEQIGAACHTGNRSCFYRELVPQQYSGRSPFTIFENAMAIIRRRKENPLEYSGVSLLSEESFDGILKKIGEKSLELIFAAKEGSGDRAEQESCDLLYYLMILSVQMGISWEDIINELSKR